MTLKIEVEKTYITRDGRKAFVSSWKEVLFGCIVGERKLRVWSANGEDTENSKERDLVSLYTDPRLKKCIEALEEISKLTYETDDGGMFVYLAEKALKEIGE